MLTKTKNFVCTVCIILQLLAFFSCKVKEDTQSNGQLLTDLQQQLVQELNQWLIPLGPSPLDLTDNELSFLDPLRDSKVVGLGEATHGTREFFQMKHRIFQYLVENCQHKAFGFEADFGESIYLDNYVTSGEGNLRELMMEKMHFWTWKTEEVKQLLEWMKNYNTGKDEEEKIHYYGFDCQFTTYQPELIHEYLLRTFPDLWETGSAVLGQVKNLSTTDYQNMSEATYNDIKTQLESFDNQIIANKNLLISNSSSSEYEITRQLLNTFVQAFVVKYQGENDISTNWRDLFMAENALWIADFFGQDTKITLWAHNGHIARYPSSGRNATMGSHLNEELNDLYQPVAFTFSQGSFTALGMDQNGNYTSVGPHQITDEPSSTSINFLFHHASHLNFAFDLNAIPTGSQWDSWLATPRSILSIGAVYNGIPGNYYRLINIPEHYSWIIYFNSTNASVMLD